MIRKVALQFTFNCVEHNAPGSSLDVPQPRQRLHVYRLACGQKSRPAAFVSAALPARFDEFGRTLAVGSRFYKHSTPDGVGKMIGSLLYTKTLTQP